MSIAITHWPDKGVGIEHDPLVYSLPIKEQWASVVETRWSTSDFPSWNAQPTSDWNFGLAVDPGKLAEQIRVERKSMTADPWVDPPVTLSAPAQRIESWKLASAAGNSTQQFTSPLRSAQDRQTAGPQQQITLVPYGSTHLRLTILADLKFLIPRSQAVVSVPLKNALAGCSFRLRRRSLERFH